MGEHWCTIHNTDFFKTKKMRTYSHPIEGTEPTEWCNEKDLEAVKNLEPQPSDNLLPKDQEIIDEATKFKPPLTRESSIERQVAIKEIGLDWREGKRKDDDPLVLVREAWLIDAINYKEAKSETTKNTASSQEAQAEPIDNQDSRETTDGEPPKTLGELYNWIQSKDPNIKVPRLWLQTELGISGEDVEVLFKTIKEKKRW